MAIQTVMPL